MGLIFSAILNRAYNSQQFLAQDETNLLAPLSPQNRKEDLHRDLADCCNSRAGFVSACYRMCCLRRQFDVSLTSSVVLMLGAFYVNLIYSFVKILYEMKSSVRAHPRLMHVLQIAVNFSIHGNYSILSSLMKVGRLEVKNRFDGLMHFSTQRKVILASEALFSRLTKLVVFSLITTLTRVDKDGVNGVSIMCVAMLTLLLTSLYIPIGGFQARHYDLYPWLSVFRERNAHPTIQLFILAFALVLSAFVLDHTSPHSAIFWITVAFVANQVRLLRMVRMFDHDPNRESAQDENLVISTTSTQIYALILILRLDSMEPGLVRFFDNISAMFTS